MYLKLASKLVIQLSYLIGGREHKVKLATTIPILLPFLIATIIVKSMNQPITSYCIKLVSRLVIYSSSLLEDR